MSSPPSIASPPPAGADADLAPIPSSLRTWFRVVGALDALSAVPLFLFPGRALRLLGWTSIDSVSARLCGAALLALGVAGLRVHRHGASGYRALLGLQVVWSLAAVVAVVAGIGDGAPPAAWAFLSIFIACAGVWVSHAVRLRQMARAHELDDGDAADNAAGDDPTD